MFWKRPDPRQPEQGTDDLRAYLTERLRDALDFATLGAYDLGAIEPGDGAQPSVLPASERRSSDRPTLTAPAVSP